jgi:hypothetical protein
MIALSKGSRRRSKEEKPHLVFCDLRLSFTCFLLTSLSFAPMVCRGSTLEPPLERENANE